MKALICGAGIAGLTLANLLARDRWEVTVVEQASSLRRDGYIIDFFGSGYDVADRMALIPRLRALRYDIPEVSWVDEHGDRMAGVTYRQFEALLGGRLMSLMRGDLEQVLFDNLPPTVEVRFGTSCAIMRQTGSAVDVALSPGEPLRVDLLVGADGIHSTIRRQCFGVEQKFVRDLGLRTAAFTFEDESFSTSIGDRFKILSVPNRQVGFYPLRGWKIAAFFVHRAQQADPLEPPGDTLARVYGDLGWLVPAGLARASSATDLHYDKVAQVDLPNWSKGRTVLIGDACHALSLLAGQGASMAMAGAYKLAGALRSETQVEDALRRYEMALRPAIRKKQAGGRRTANWLVPRTRLQLAVRNKAMNLAERRPLRGLLRPIYLSAARSFVHE